MFYKMKFFVLLVVFITLFIMVFGTNNGICGTNEPEIILGPTLGLKRGEVKTITCNIKLHMTNLDSVKAYYINHKQFIPQIGMQGVQADIDISQWTKIDDISFKKNGAASIYFGAKIKNSALFGHTETETYNFVWKVEYHIPDKDKEVKKINKLGSFTVIGPPDFSLLYGPDPIVIKHIITIGGQSKLDIKAVYKNDLQGPVAVTFSNLPPGTTAQPQSLSFSHTQQIKSVIFKASANTLLGTYTGTIIGKSGTITHNENFTIKIENMEHPDVLRDLDHDGIDDIAEKNLIDMYCPYYFWDRKENDYRPADPNWYLRLSELSTSPVEDDDAAVITHYPHLDEFTLLAANQNGFGYSDITKNPHRTHYYINPLATPPGYPSDSNPGRHGEPWDYILQYKNVGLFAHVVQSEESKNSRVPQHADRYKYYKIEFWQFFGFNNIDIGDIGKHEGDWEGLQLWIDPTIPDEEKRIVAVIHLAHGDGVRFEMANADENRTSFQQNPDIKILKGKGPNGDRDFTSGNYATALSATAQDNELRLYKDPVSGKYTHPVAFIEQSTHGFWPTDRGGWIRAGTHRGDGQHYLTANVPNLGEVSYYIPNSIFFDSILHFNGYWGAYSDNNDPPVGPPLHWNWTWPADDPIRNQLQDQAAQNFE